MGEDKILYIPIQLNGNTKKGYDENQNLADFAGYGGLKDREIFVIRNGVLYVGVEEYKDGVGTGKIVPVVAQGRVVPNAELRNPVVVGGLKLKNDSTFGTVLVDSAAALKNVPAVEGKVVFVDTGSTLG